jgi:hypothetical protein
MDEQQGWREHADFMNGLYADGFVLLGGPLPQAWISRLAGLEVTERRSGRSFWRPLEAAFLKVSSVTSTNIRHL